MNKLLIVLLAVCLVSVHGFVKREAPDAATSIDEFANTLKESTEKLMKNVADKVSPDNIKKQFSEIVDNINKAVEDLKKPSGEAPKS